MLRITVGLLVLVVFGGCAKKEPSQAAGHGAHAHAAPHGGTLVELGAHAYNLEFVRDSSAGKITVYVLDGHAEHFIRVKAPTLELIATVGADKRPLTLRGVANPATGETIGDTSQFEASAEWLKASTGFEIVIPSLEIRGTAFENLSVRVPGASD